MAKKRKFDKANYIPNSEKYAQSYLYTNTSERDGIKENIIQRSKLMSKKK